MKILKLKSLVLIQLITTIFIITSCNEENKDEHKPVFENERNIIKNYLLDEGFKENQIYFKESNVHYSACEHNEYKHSIAEMLTIIEDKQRQRTNSQIDSDEIGFRNQVNDDKTNILSINKVGQLKYQFDSSVPSVWKNAIRDGINKINTMSIVGGRTRCAVKFTEEPRPGYSYDTKFYVQDLGTNSDGDRILGRANQPSNGVIDNSILLDEDSPSISDNKKVATVIHELYHALGFRHSGTNDGLLIGGTGKNDPKSIMQPIISNTNLTPSLHDIKALKKVYPSWLKKPALPYAYRINNNKDVAFTYKNEGPNHPYFWIKAEAGYFSSGDFQRVASKWYKVNDLSSKQENLKWTNVSSNATHIRVRGYNYKGDKYSNWSPYNSI